MLSSKTEVFLNQSAHCIVNSSFSFIIMFNKTMVKGVETSSIDMYLLSPLVIFYGYKQPTVMIAHKLLDESQTQYDIPQNNLNKEVLLPLGEKSQLCNV